VSVSKQGFLKETTKNFFVSSKYIIREWNEKKWGKSHFLQYSFMDRADNSSIERENPEEDDCRETYYRFDARPKSRLVNHFHADVIHGNYH